jgi:integrase
MYDEFTSDLHAALSERAEAQDIGMNPTKGIRLPAGRGHRDRIASPDEAAKLVAVLSEDDALIFATAMYAGLRRGELMALRWTTSTYKPGADPRRAVLGSPRGRNRPEVDQG